MKSRRINVDGTKDKIQLVAYIEGAFSKDPETVLELYINDHMHDSLRQKTFETGSNFDFTLIGTLDDGIPVRLEILGRFLKRPVYKFYVGDQVVHEEKGSFGGF